eukprot:NODE_3471_length_551_cov_13.776892_g2933_i0.p4 GENE.NODE_3471_length_551_cov_13.776892_g2933_i0~~NODE_3471_length_551_cov_13.776892_g2933_i0.p4  ORF type:complete len:52 (+),score=16.81 NODE_3471_length_551_cov_13.776892_g2933_i0:394-549(+)
MSQLTMCVFMLKWGDVTEVVKSFDANIENGLVLSAVMLHLYAKAVTPCTLR